MTRARELANLAGVSETPLSNRSLVINGAMQVHQRGNQSVSSGNSYSLDRWEVATVGGSAAYDLQQSTDVPTGQGFANSFKIDVTTADTAMGAGDGYFFRQAFEGQNLQSIKKGTSNAEQVTVQFWVKSTKTGTYILELYDTDNTRQVSKSYTVSSADTWEYKTVTFPADTSGAMDNDNARSLLLQWWLAAGSDFTSGTLNTTWASATSANRVVGQVNALDNASNNFHVVGVQMELGEQATPFEHRSYGEELTICKRYFHAYGGGVDEYPVTGVWTGSEAIFPFTFAEMRAAPTVTSSAANTFKAVREAVAWSTGTSVSVSTITKQAYSMVLTASSDTRGYASRLHITTSAYIHADAEL